MTAHRHHVAPLHAVRRHHRGTVADYVVSQQGRKVSLRELAEQLGLSAADAEHFASHYANMGDIKAVEHRGRVRYVPPTSNVRQLPIAPMLPGPGARRDCDRDSECLGAIMRAHPLAVASHCPVGCSRFVPPAPRSGWQTGEHPIAKLQRLHGQADEDDPTTRRRAR